MSFAERLKSCRAKKGVFQRDVSSAAGMDIRTYQRYEAGTQAPLLASVERLADYFGVSLDYLAGRTDETHD